MARLFEWLLATFGALICIGGAIGFWQAQSSPGTSLWPLPALALIQMAVLGLVGAFAIALDDAQRPAQWGVVIWVVCGALTALMVLGVWSIGPLLALAVLAFAGAALLADRRNARQLPKQLGVFTLGTLSNAVLLFLLIVIR